MDFNAMSDEALRGFYEAIRNALKEDDSLIEKKYYVREFEDWKDFASELEAAMTKKDMAYKPIDW